jgi:hypothetical protein
VVLVLLPDGILSNTDDISVFYTAFYRILMIYQYFTLTPYDRRTESRSLRANLCAHRGPGPLTAHTDKARASARGGRARSLPH